MNLFEKFRQTILVAGILFLGGLFGLAYGVLVEGWSLGSTGVVALFANAAGATIGAMITLQVAERRAAREADAAAAKKRQRVKLLFSILSSRLKVICLELENDHITARTLNAFHELGAVLDDLRTLFDEIFDAVGLEILARAMPTLTQVRRIVLWLQEENREEQRVLLHRANRKTTLADFKQAAALLDELGQMIDVG